MGLHQFRFSVRGHWRAQDHSCCGGGRDLPPGRTDMTTNPTQVFPTEGIDAPEAPRPITSLRMNQVTDYSGFSPEPFRQKRYRVDRDGKLVLTWSTDQEIMHILGGVPPGR